MQIAEIFGGDITFETPFQNIGCWHDAQDHAAWTVQLDKEGRFDVYLDYACDNPSAGNRFVLEGAQPTLRGQSLHMASEEDKCSAWAW